MSEERIIGLPLSLKLGDRHLLLAQIDLVVTGVC